MRGDARRLRRVPPGSLTARALTALARLRARASRARPPREELIARHARGRSFADVGCMWSVDGALCFAALDAGATRVAGLDVMAASAAFATQNARRGGAVRFVQGDLHDPAAVAALGRHDVVWCSGLLYHSPHPLLALERLREITGETLLLAGETLPEVPGLRRGAVFAPSPASHPALAEPLDAAGGYRGWWWGLTPSAMRAMVEHSGFAVQAEHRTPLHLTLVARPR